jgi:hypothetical protein
MLRRPAEAKSVWSIRGTPVVISVVTGAGHLAAARRTVHGVICHHHVPMAVVGALWKIGNSQARSAKGEKSRRCVEFPGMLNGYVERVGLETGA